MGGETGSSCVCVCVPVGMVVLEPILQRVCVCRLMCTCVGVDILGTLFFTPSPPSPIKCYHHPIPPEKKRKKTPASMSVCLQGVEGAQRRSLGVFGGGMEEGMRTQSEHKEEREIEGANQLPLYT